jgi:serine/threonine protein phosphatase 1
MQTLVIGDIHGCYFELQALLDKAGLSDGDSIISLGDFVDRGPETPQVLDFFRYTPNARALMGNHERKHVRAARGEVKLAISQHISRQQLGENYADAVIWMGSLPLFLELPEAILVHGYLEPDLALAEQNPSVVCGTMGGDKILRERYARPWYEYEQGDKPVIVGHYNYTDSDQPFIYQDRVFGLDTGCVHGKTLTGLLLPSFRIVSVSSRGDLWRQVRRTYNKPLSPPKPVISWAAQDELLLDKLVEQAKVANETLLARLHQEPDFAELTPRQQGKRYAENTGAGMFASLMQLARLGKLDAEMARKIVKEPGTVRKLLANHFIPETDNG